MSVRARVRVYRDGKVTFKTYFITDYTIHALKVFGNVFFYIT